jgi:RNase P subunit RPR2
VEGNKMNKEKRDKVQESIDKMLGKEYPRFFCETCGSRLIRGKIKVSNYDLDTGMPVYSVILSCPQKAFLSHRTKIHLSRDGDGTWSRIRDECE